MEADWKPTLPAPPHRTFGLLKPDAAPRAKEILEVIANEGFYVSCGRPRLLTRTHVDAFYVEHSTKRPLPSWYEEHAVFMESGIVIPMLICNFPDRESKPTLSRFRELVGTTDPLQAAPDTLRWKFGTGLPQNVIHASDSSEAAERETAFFFTTNDLIDRLCF